MILTAFIACTFLLQCSMGLDDPPKLMNMEVSDHLTKSIVTTVNEPQPLAPQQRSSVRQTFGDNRYLKWVRWTGSLPNWAVSVYNQAARRTDYVCVPISGCDWSPGYYSPSRGSFCTHTCRGEKRTNQFDLLVNEQNLELLQWKPFPGYTPSNLIAARVKYEVYVGKNQYGIGPYRKKIFSVALNGKEVTYKNNFDILTLKKEKYRERMFNLKYQVDQMTTDSQQPIVIGQYKATNNNCQSVTQTVRLDQSVQRQSTWQTSTTSTLKLSSSITTGVPVFSVTAGIEYSSAKTYSDGNSVTEIINHSVTLQVEVPANQFCVVRMTGKRYDLNMPFTASLAKEYTDGTVHTVSVSGLYQGVQVGEVNVVADRCQPNPNPKPCGLQVADPQ
ncbi:hypothetical protein UPYG_G00071050 [Umbra pygmaea]|uniref:Natterin-3-like n=1 Tax=Umbra pygmaea TaxID=75934 RepID=A0ABD0XBK5_UMBPY